MLHLNKEKLEDWNEAFASSISKDLEFIFLFIVVNEIPDGAIEFKRANKYNAECTIWANDLAISECKF